MAHPAAAGLPCRRRSLREPDSLYGVAMLFDSFLPGDLFTPDGQGMQELFRVILMRTNLVPVLRHVIGWRGLKQVPGPVECWTAKVEGFAGVFGISFGGVDTGPDWVRGTFQLHYFPHRTKNWSNGVRCRQRP